MAPRFAGRRDDGKYAFVVTTRWFDQETRQLVWEIGISEAKAAHAFTRELHTTRKVRRATVHDVQNLDRG